MPTLLHLSPHPDDELIGAPATLFALRDAGWRIVNLACGLGRPEQRERREAEVREACRRAGFELRLPAGDAVVAEAVAELRPEIVASPHPHDRHPAHEAVAREAREALESRGDDAPRWWMWGLWRDLPLPTILTPFDEGRLGEILAALDAHAGELGRNDYRRLVRGRAEANAVLGPELVFGLGSPGTDARYVELLTEAAYERGRWLLGRPRRLDPADPLPDVADVDVTDRLRATQ